MKRLGSYISPNADTASSSPYFTKGCFVYYEYASNYHCDIAPHIKIWRLDANFSKQPDEIIFLKSLDELNKHIEQSDRLANHYISYHDRLYHIRNMTYRYARLADIEIIDELVINAVDHYETWRHEGSSAIQFLKDAKLIQRSTHHIYKFHKLTEADMFDFSSLTMPETVDDMIKKQLKESLEKSIMNSCYGIGGFTTKTDPFTIVKMLPHEEKETKTMEKKKMTETDSFLKNLNGITITSTYSKLHHGISKPYYIYYPEMEITDDMADTLLTVLLVAKREYIHKVVFNPEKGTTTIYRGYGDGSVTVKCRDGEFDYILGYNMARTKLYLGSDDYNWFNKIKNHRKTHIEYTEPEKPKAKRGGKK